MVRNQAVRSESEERMMKTFNIGGCLFASKRLRMLVFKAEEAGRRIVAVDPRFTSQTCPCCGYKDAKNRPSQAEFKCLKCDLEAKADFLASVSISARIEPLGVNVERLPHA